MSCKYKFNNRDQFEYCCYHKDLIDEKPRKTNDQLQINFVIAFEQAYIQIINEQLQAEHAETDEEAEEEYSDDEDFEET
ncbi:9379_t:CDS:1, partial [Gigaspora margarita]